MKRILFLLLIAGFCLALPPAAAAEPTAPEIVKSMAADAVKYKTFQTVLTSEQITDKKLKTVTTSTVRFLRVGQEKLRVEINSFWIIRNGPTVWIKMGKNVMQRSASESDGNPMGKKSLIYQYLAGQVDLTQFKSFALLGTENAEGVKLYHLKATPKGAGLSEEIWVRGGDWLPVKGIFKNGTDKASDTSFTLKETKINEPIDDSLFVYTGPVTKSNN